MAYTETSSDADAAPVSSDLPLDLAHLDSGGLGPSLMARAQRGSLLQRQLTDDATRLAAELATSPLLREQSHNALRQQRLDLQTRERATQLSTDLRMGFDPEQFSAQVDAIRDRPDPTLQLGAIGALRSAYARYRTVPELARLMDAQLATLGPTIVARQEARLHERISANRYAFTPEEAEQKFPGYRITPTPLPTGPTGKSGGPARLIYLAEDDVDPRLEAEAFHLLRTAAAWGDSTKLEALGRDPAVAAVLRVPGSKFADAYIGAVAAARELAPASASSATVAPVSIVPAVSRAEPASDALAGRAVDSPVPASAAGSGAAGSGGIPYGATVATPMGFATVPYPKDYRPSPESYFPAWFRKLVTPDPHPELSTIADVLARDGRYADSTIERDRPQLISPNSKKPQVRTAEFEEPFLKNVVDGLKYSVLSGTEKKREPSPKGGPLDGVMPKNDVLSGAPERHVQIARGGQAAVGMANSLMAGQVQSAMTMRRFKFVYDDNDGSWRLVDISPGRPPDGGYMVLPEGQARQIIADIFENYDRPAPKFGPYRPPPAPGR